VRDLLRFFRDASPQQAHDVYERLDGRAHRAYRSAMDQGWLVRNYQQSVGHYYAYPALTVRGRFVLAVAEMRRTWARRWRSQGRDVFVQERRKLAPRLGKRERLRLKRFMRKTV
jgi:hypothetical protein